MKKCLLGLVLVGFSLSAFSGLTSVNWRMPPKNMGPGVCFPEFLPVYSLDAPGTMPPFECTFYANTDYPLLVEVNIKGYVAAQGYNKSADYEVYPSGITLRFKADPGLRWRPTRMTVMAWPRAKQSCPPSHYIPGAIRMTCHYIP